VITGDRRSATGLFAKGSPRRSTLSLISQTPSPDSRRQPAARKLDAQLTLDLLRGKWKIEILQLLMNGPVRLGQVRRRIPQATKKMLVQRLHEMEKQGIITRADLSGKIKHVKYTVSTPLGDAVLQLLAILRKWSVLHLPVQAIDIPAASAPASRQTVLLSSAKPPRSATSQGCTGAKTCMTGLR
jgi:DNA-binding HxlR family transcriptional regulator